ncbi:acyltransferase [Escherichia coli]|uniref:acyltransferase family protein n=1 Tax=Escherichia coli TaxID=562 RepID=UPI001ABD0410|nr:acyltransferase [Escherichia coli]MDZ7124922.1 acyltransferase [Escherichia coli]HAX6840153.1 acyltransferase [Escherichia coli]HAX7084982.1 acyltransferase [Escherichia coli]
MEKLRPNSDIEILRAFAIIMVLIQHYPSLYFWSDHSFFTNVNKHISFWSGVDLFLCISGFVVSCSLIPLIDKCKDAGVSSSKAIKAFFIKRAFRLFPTSFLWIAILLAFTFFYNISGAFGNAKWNIYQALSVLTYNYNYLSAYMSNNGLPATFGPFWSLNLEEQFYFIFPFFVLFTKKENRIPLLIVIIAIQFFILRQGTILLNFRLDAISWGVVLAIIYMKNGMENVEPTFMQKKCRSLLVTFFLMAFLMISIPDMHESRFMIGFLALASAALVFIASFNKKYIYCPEALRKVLLWVGSRSYAIYVIHMPVIYFIQESTVRYYVSIGQGPSKTILLCAIMTILAIVATILLAEINYRCIEKPLRNLGRRYAKKISS